MPKEIEVVEQETEKIGNEHLYEMLTGKEMSWHAIIYDLMNTGQLDPWDIDLALLAKKYLEKIKLLEESNFIVSSKVLLVASLLLRIKSEILLNEYVRSIDDILFGKKEQGKKPERIILDENELPILYPRTPLPRMRKVSLQELMSALNKAISTETRRIRREIIDKQAEKMADIVLPKSRINVKDRIRKIYSRILTMFKAKQSKVSYTELVGVDKEEKISSFLPVLHLDNQQKVFLEQEKHFEEIYVWLYSHYLKNKPEIPSEKQLERESELSEEAGFENPMAGLYEEVEK